jgi:hypothetical protein
LFIALLFAQIFTFLADIAMVVLDFVDMFTLKAALHPFIYAIKLKIEFIVLNQLTCLVQPNSDFFVYLGDPTLHKHGGNKRRSRRQTTAYTRQISHEQEHPQCLKCSSLEIELCSQNSSTDSEPATPQHISFQANLRRPQARFLQDIGSLVPMKRSPTNEMDDRGDRVFIDLERQYLGQYDRHAQNSPNG